MDAIAREGYYQITDLKIRRRSQAEDHLRSFTGCIRVDKLSASRRSCTEMTGDNLVLRRRAPSLEGREVEMGSASKICSSLETASTKLAHFDRFTTGRLRSAANRSGLSIQSESVTIIDDSRFHRRQFLEKWLNHRSLWR